MINLVVVKRHASSVQADTVHFISMGIVSLETWHTGVMISLASLKDVNLEKAILNVRESNYNSSQKHI